MGQDGRQVIPSPTLGALKDATWTARSAAPTTSPSWSSSAVSTRRGRRISPDRIDEVVRAGRSKSWSTWRASPTSARTGSRLLVRYHRQLAKIGGRFRIVADSEAVSHVLKLTGVWRILHDDEPSPGSSRRLRRLEARQSSGGMVLHVFAKCDGGAERLELIGDPTRLPGRGYDKADERPGVRSRDGCRLRSGGSRPELRGVPGAFRRVPGRRGRRGLPAERGAGPA